MISNIAVIIAALFTIGFIYALGEVCSKFSKQKKRKPKSKTHCKTTVKHDEVILDSDILDNIQRLIREKKATRTAQNSQGSSTD